LPFLFCLKEETDHCVVWSCALVTFNFRYNGDQCLLLFYLLWYCQREEWRNGHKTCSDSSSFILQIAGLFTPRLALKPWSFLTIDDLSHTVCSSLLQSEFSCLKLFALSTSFSYMLSKTRFLQFLWESLVFKKELTILDFVFTWFLLMSSNLIILVSSWILILCSVCFELNEFLNCQDCHLWPPQRFFKAFDPCFG